MGVLPTMQEKWGIRFDFPVDRMILISGTAGVFLTLIWAVRVFMTRSQVRQGPTSTKAQRAKSMKQEFEANDSHNGITNRMSSFLSSNKMTGPSMEISQLWLHPIKSIRGCRVSTATLTKEGFRYDRKYVLLRVSEELRLKHMGVQKYPEMCLFHTSINGNKLVVSYQPPGTDVATHELEIPLEPPNFQKLEKVGVEMYGSANQSYNMGDKYNKWFSERFGFEIILAYWGGNPRPVLGSIPGSPEGPRPKSLVGSVLRYVPIIGRRYEIDDGAIAFNDCAPYLVITEESTADVTSRLPDGVEMDISKFRGNIVLKGSPIPYDEDFWGELMFGDDTKVILTGNCGRCISLNIDYETGKSGTGRAGEVLKLLTKDRRVDLGVKYSPIFGRYGFVSKRSEGRILTVGDDVAVSQRNTERTRFYWPGLST